MDLKSKCDKLEGKLPHFLIERTRVQIILLFLVADQDLCLDELTEDL